MKVNKPVCFIGVDPGAKGAWCFNIPEEKVVIFLDNVTSSKRIVNFLKNIQHEYNIRVIILEDVHSMVSMSAKSNFMFGYNVGVVNLLAELSELPRDKVKPKDWQKALGIISKKWPKETRSSVRSKWLKTAVAEKVIAIYPYAEKDVHGPRGGLIDGRTDALAISHYARMKYIT